MHRGTAGKGTQEGFEKLRDAISKLGKRLGKRGFGTGGGTNQLGGVWRKEGKIKGSPQSRF